MLEVFVNNKLQAEIKHVPVPKPGPEEVLIKVIATDSNPKDWQFPMESESPLNAGDDISGIVEDVGRSVYEYRKGDRVAAFHKMGAQHGSYAEYAIAPATTTFRLPPNISFEQGATLPLASMTAALALYTHLNLPAPWNPVSEGNKIPILIYGGASAVGAFALKFAKLSNLGPIITVAGSSMDFVGGLKAADHIIDYRKNNVVNDIKKALGNTKLRHAIDAISDHGSWQNIAAVLDDTSEAYLNMLDPPEDIALPENIVLTRTYVASAYGEPHARRTAVQATNDRDFAHVFYRYISLLLAENRLSPHPHRIVPGGLQGVETGINMLYNGKVHAEKLVYRLADTKGIES